MHEQVIGQHGDTSRRAIALHRELVLPVASLLAVAAAVFLALMLINAHRLDAKSKEASIGAMQAGLDERAGQLDRVVKDYAWWNEAVEEVQIKGDRAWAEARLGAYLYGTHEYDWAFVVAPDGSTFHAAYQGETVAQDIGTALGDDLWRRLVERAVASVQAGEPMAVHAYLRMRGGNTGIGSAAAIMPESSWTGELPKGAPYVLVVVRQLAPEWFSELARALDIEGLRFERIYPFDEAAPEPVRPISRPKAGTARTGEAADGRSGGWWRELTSGGLRPPAALELVGPEGGREADRLVGGAIWQPRRPGTEYLVSLAPSLAMAFVLFVAFGWSALRHSRTSTAAIVESEDRFRDVADASSDWIFETDAKGRITWISGRFIALTGIPLGEIEGRAITDLLLPMAGEDRSGELDEAIREQRLFRSIPRCYLDQEGRPRALRVSGKPTRDHAGQHVGWRGTATDVTVEIEARRTAEFLSGHDALTGTLNRQGLLEATTGLIDAACRLGQTAGFLMLDIDRFKEVNDVHGPIVGDQLIRAVTQR
ncbi:MAG: CHASE4 domain-containing protein, partial [Geminicoccaceae bacterium]